MRSIPECTDGRGCVFDGDKCRHARSGSIVYSGNSKRVGCSEYQERPDKAEQVADEVIINLDARCLPAPKALKKIIVDAVRKIYGE